MHKEVQQELITAWAQNNRPKCQGEFEVLNNCNNKKPLKIQKLQRQG